MNYSIQSADQKLLNDLQQHGRSSMQEVAERTSLSASQCWRRVKDLEAAGIIAGYGAKVDAKAVGLNAIAYIQVALKDHQADSIDRFVRMVELDPNIVECATITGDHDYLLKVYAKTPTDLEAFVMRRLLMSGMVKDTRSNFVLNEIKTRGPLPIHRTAGT